MEKINFILNNFFLSLDKNKYNLSNSKIEFIFKDSEFINILYSNLLDQQRYLACENNGIPTYIDLNNKVQNLQLFIRLNNTTEIQNSNLIPSNYSMITGIHIDDSDWSSKLDKFTSYLSSRFFTKKIISTKNQCNTNKIKSSYLGNFFSVNSDNSFYILDGRSNVLSVMKLNLNFKIEFLTWHPCINNKLTVVGNNILTSFSIINNQLKQEDKCIYSYRNIIDAVYSKDGK